MEIDLELTEKSAKNTQRWWKLTATIDLVYAQYCEPRFSPFKKYLLAEIIIFYFYSTH